MEDAWPEYATRTTLLAKPIYITEAQRDLAAGETLGHSQEAGFPAPEAMSGEDFAAAYRLDVQEVQQLRQHHVHLFGPDGKSRVPHRYCRVKGDPNKCRAGFPKTLLPSHARRTVVVCKGIAQHCHMSITGARNTIGSLMSYRNDEWLNGTHPALLVALRCNSDVQVPYRLPVCLETHAVDVCPTPDSCISSASGADT